MTVDEAVAFLASFPDSWQDRTSQPGLILFKTHQSQPESARIFAMVVEGSLPTRIDLRCDPLLAQKLRREYETVLASQKFERRTWNTIIDTGQLSVEEIKDLMRLSFNLTSELN